MMPRDLHKPVGENNEFLVFVDGWVRKGAFWCFDVGHGKTGGLLNITQVRDFGTNGMLVEVKNGPPGSLFPYVRRLIAKTYWPDLDARDSDRLPCIRAVR